MAKKKEKDETVEKTNRDFFDDILKEAGVDIPVAESVNEGAVTTFYNTGSLAFNALISGSMNGGFAGNKVIALAGEEATGKSFIALQIVQNFLNQNSTGQVLYFDSEDAITNQMMIDRQIDIKRVRKKRVKTVQEFRTMVIRILDAYLEKPEKERLPMFIVLDSLGNLSTTKEMNDTKSGAVNQKGEEVRDMTRAPAVRGLFRVLTIKLGEAKAAMLITNHTYDTMNPYGAAKAMCLLNGTQLVTANGSISIENIKVGDYVSTTLGLSEVNAVFEYDIDEIYDITLEDGTVISCTGEHKFLTNDLQWTAVEDLLVGKEINQFKKVTIQKIEKRIGNFKVRDIEVVDESHYLISTKNHNLNMISHNSGGGGIKFAASTIVFLSKKKFRDGDENDDKSAGREVSGSMLTATLEKSRFTRPGQTCELLLRHESGLDKYWGLFDLGKEKGLIVKDGNQYIFPDGQTAYRKEINANPSKFFDTPDNFAAFEELCQRTFSFGKGEVAIEEDELEEELVDTTEQ